MPFEDRDLRNLDEDPIARGEVKLGRLLDHQTSNPVTQLKSDLGDFVELTYLTCLT
jgi:hypothetical protein